jgi:hypothetical protein
VLLVACVLVLRLTARGYALLLRVLSGVGYILSWMTFGIENVNSEPVARYVVVGHLPRRAYDGESFSVSLVVACTSGDRFSRHYRIKIRPDIYPNATFEVYLIAPSFDKEPLGASRIGPIGINGHALARWILHAKASGNQMLLFRIYHCDTLVGECGMYLRVTKAFGMTANQVFAAGCALGLLSGLLAAASTLRSLLFR